MQEDERSTTSSKRYMRPECAEATGDGPHSHSEDDEPSVREEIKGIPEDAHVSEEPRIGFHTPTDDTIDHSEAAAQEKGKGKA